MKNRKGKKRRSQFAPNVLEGLGKVPEKSPVSSGADLVRLL